MVPGASRRVFSWIWSTHVGDPLPHRQKGVLDCISCNRFVTLSGLAVAESKDEEVGDFGFSVADAGEVRTDSEGGAEALPEAEDGRPGFVRLGSVGSSRDLQSSAEVSCELVSGRSRSSRQPWGCG